MRSYKSVRKYSLLLFVFLALPASTLPQEQKKATDDDKKKVFGVVSSDTDSTGLVTTVIEKNGEGRTRTTVVHKFAHDPEVVKSQFTYTEKLTDGGVLIRENSELFKYDRDGNQVYHSKEAYDGRGNVLSGERWHMPEFNGNFSGPITVEEFDSRSSEWKKKASGVSGDWEFNGTIGFNTCDKGTIIRIVQTGNTVTAKFTRVHSALRECYDQGAVFFQGVKQPDGTFKGKMNVTWWEEDSVADLVLTIQDDGSLRGTAGLGIFNLKRRSS